MEAETKDVAKNSMTEKPEADYFFQEKSGELSVYSDRTKEDIRGTAATKSRAGNPHRMILGSEEQQEVCLAAQTLQLSAHFCRWHQPGDTLRLSCKF